MTYFYLIPNNQDSLLPHPEHLATISHKRGTYYINGGKFEGIPDLSSDPKQIYNRIIEKTSEIYSEDQIRENAYIATIES